MKPERAIERAAHRRAAMYVAELGWLDGFPLDEHSWHVLGAMTPIAIDGARIAKSRRAARSALREHRDGLAAIVGDVERWWSIVDAKLAWCSSPKRPLDLIDQMPPRAARSARALPPELQPAIVAASIVWATRPAELACVIAWLAAHANVMAFGLARTIELAAISLDDQAGADAILAVLLVDAPDPAIAVQRVTAAETRINAAGSKRPGRNPQVLDPIPTMGTDVVEWFDRVVAYEPDRKRRVVRLVAAADLAGALAPWRRWLDDNAAKLARVFDFVGKRLDASDLRQVAGVARSLAAIRADVPAASIVLREALLDVDLLARDDRHHEAAGRFIAHVPESSPVARARMLVHCARISVYAEDSCAAWIWEAIADGLDAGGSPDIYAPWWDLLGKARSIYLETQLFQRPSRARVRHWAAIIATLPEEVSRRDAERVATWLETSLDHALIRDTVVGERHFAGTLAVDLARVAVSLFDGTATDLAWLASELMAIDEDRAASVARVIDHALAAGAGWLVRDLLATHDTARIVETARLAALVPRRQWPAIARAAPSPWTARYPDALAIGLRRLAMVRSDADDVARRRLAPHIADPDALRIEIAALEARQPLAPSLAKRLANLENRLRAPRLPSTRKLDRLAADLARFAVTTGLDRFDAAITEAATTHLARAFGLGRWPGWTLDRRTTEIFFALVQLPAAERAVAGRLLRARTGSRPWDLRDEPANRAVVERLRASGLVMEPWLDDAPVTRRGGDGLPVELALEGDPLEVFAMGAHFETCLSPNSVNFFSVVANAADVNKRVLYARRAGAVVGRCLLAITDTGALLAFRPYRHLHELGFDAVVAAFTAELADRMGTVVAPHGHVSLVVAPRWYDDGSRDLAGQFTSLYNIDTATIEPAAFVPAIRAALGRELDELTLPYVVDSPGLLRRPELVLVLAPHLLAHRIEPRTMVTAARMALHAGDRELADRLLGDHGDAVDLYYSHGEILSLLRPSQTLARLRATRRRGEDVSFDRQMLEAIALEELHRPAQAAAIYENLLRFRVPFADEVRRRLEAIARPGSAGSRSNA